MKNKFYPLIILTIISIFTVAAVIHMRQKPQAAENNQINRKQTNTEPIISSGPTQSTPSPSQSPTTTPKTSQQTQTAKAAIHYTLFFGDGCPHCAKVEEFILQNDITNKLPLNSKEVYNNSNNAAELGQAAKACGLPTDSIGVPFLYDGSKCVVGDADIINLFKQKLNIP